MKTGEPEFVHLESLDSCVPVELLASDYQDNCLISLLHSTCGEMALGYNRNCYGLQTTNRELVQFCKLD